MVTSSSNVRVLARVRPSLAHEYQYEQAAEVPSSNMVCLRSAKQSYESSYDRVLPETANQDVMYSCVKDCVPSLLAGYNNTVLAYGQTGTGKTFTMIGDQAMTLAQACSSPSSSSGHGIVPRAVHELFQELDRRRSAAAPGAEADVKLVLSYLEIYNDRLFDLLQPYKRSMSKDPSRVAVSKTSLEVREDPMAGTHVPNLLYVDVQNSRQVLQLIAAGNCNRATAHTDRNQHSSRSHAILQFWLEQRPSAAAVVATNTSVGSAASAASVVVRSKLNFVDLAGSERWGKAHSEAEDKTLVNELTSINNSLSALALVVAALTDKAAKHVPYRSSRLTHLLQDSLGGNCNTSLIVTIAPCMDAFEESLATLKFADRARNISNKAVVNSMHDTDTILAIKEREIQRLRALLASYTSAAGGTPVSGSSQQQQWQEWATADGVLGSQQDALLLPSSKPTSPYAPVVSSIASTASRTQQMMLTQSGCDSPRASAVALSSPSATTSVTAVAAAAAAAAAADRAALEAELAAARAALELERNIRNALEGQIQELSAAAQAQQEATAATATATRSNDISPAPVVTNSSSGHDTTGGPNSLLKTAQVTPFTGYTSAVIRQAVASRDSERPNAQHALEAWLSPKASEGSYHVVSSAALAAYRSSPSAAAESKLRTQQKQQLVQQVSRQSQLASAQQQQQKQQQHRHTGVDSQHEKQHQPKAWNDNWQSPTLTSSRTSNKSGKLSSTNTLSKTSPWKSTADATSSPANSVPGQHAHYVAATVGESSSRKSARNQLSRSLGDIYAGGMTKGRWSKSGVLTSPSSRGSPSPGKSATAAGGSTGVVPTRTAGYQSARGGYQQRSANLMPTFSSPVPAPVDHPVEQTTAAVVGADDMLHLPQLVREAVSPQPKSPRRNAGSKSAQRGGPAVHYKRPHKAAAVQYVPMPLLSQSSPAIVRTAPAAVSSSTTPTTGPKKLQVQQVSGGTAAAAAATGAPSSGGWGRSWLLQQLQQQQPSPDVVVPVVQATIAGPTAALESPVLLRHSSNSNKVLPAADFRSGGAESFAAAPSEQQEECASVMQQQQQQNQSERVNDAASEHYSEEYEQQEAEAAAEQQCDDERYSDGFDVATTDADSSQVAHDKHTANISGADASGLQQPTPWDVLPEPAQLQQELRSSSRASSASTPASADARLSSASHKQQATAAAAVCSTADATQPEGDMVDGITVSSSLPSDVLKHSNADPGPASLAGSRSLHNSYAEFSEDTSTAPVESSTEAPAPVRAPLEEATNDATGSDAASDDAAELPTSDSPTTAVDASAARCSNDGDEASLVLPNADGSTATSGDAAMVGSYVYHVCSDEGSADEQVPACSNGQPEDEVQQQMDTDTMQLQQEGVQQATECYHLRSYDSIQQQDAVNSGLAPCEGQCSDVSNCQEQPVQPVQLQPQSMENEAEQYADTERYAGSVDDDDDASNPVSKDSAVDLLRSAAEFIRASQAED